MEIRTKIIKIAAIITVIITALAYCSVRNEIKIQTLLKDKYGEKFKIIKTWQQSTGGGLGSSDYYAVCSPTADSEIVFQTVVYDFKEKDFEDTYPQGIISKELSGFLESKIDGYFDEYFVCSHISVNPYLRFDSKNDVTLESFLEKSQNKHSIHCFIIVNSDVYKSTKYEEELEFLIELLDEMEGTGINSFVKVCFLPTDVYIKYIDVIKYDTEGWTSSNVIIENYKSYSLNYMNNGELAFWFKSFDSIKITEQEYLSLRKDEITIEEFVEMKRNEEKNQTDKQ